MIRKIVLYDVAQDNWQVFTNPVHTITVTKRTEVMPALVKIEQLVEQNQLSAAGFISYEAAASFDAAHTTKRDANFPLLLFGLYASCDRCQHLSDIAPVPAAVARTWQLDITPRWYRQKIAQIHAALARGECYQINLTTRRYASGIDSPWGLFCQMARDKPPYAAYIESDDWALCCASPELFFQLQGQQLIARPMKGTASRGDSQHADLAQQDWLQGSSKNRAENMMIVDMLRNDLGRIATPGTVGVEDMFKIERYRTLLQMTSTVRARTDARISDIIAALFPCASITGAPKIAAMQLIAELEESPRRAYSGSIGLIEPGHQARFNVAIRTALVNRHNANACYGCGGGIVWDSNADEELHEITLKSKVLDGDLDTFQLLETMRWSGQEFWLQARHLTRLCRSASMLGFDLEPALLQKLLASYRHATPQRVRLIVHESGRMQLQAQDMPIQTQIPRVALSAHPIDAGSIWLAHKTTIRAQYEEALAKHPQADDVILWNQRGQLTEATRANIAIKQGGVWLTPHTDTGLLPGTLREEMLQNNQLKTAHLTKTHLNRSEIQLLNSVRGRLSVEWLD